MIIVFSNILFTPKEFTYKKIANTLSAANKIIRQCIMTLKIDHRIYESKFN